MIRTVTVSVAGTLAVLLGGWTAWARSTEWRTGRVELHNDGPPLVVQGLDEPGERPLGEPFDLVKKTTLALPNGDYRLRITRPDRRGRTFRFAVNRGESFAREIALEDGRLLGRELATLR